MAQDTANALTDFDLCLALSEVALNTQLEYAWKAWQRRGSLDGRVSILEAGTGLEATVAAPTVALDQGDDRSEQVGVTLRLPSGEVSYLDERGVRAVQEVVEWSVSFRADLARDTVDPETLAAIDPDAWQAAAQVIADSPGVPDAAFSIEYVFLRLTDVDLLAAGHDIRVPSEVPAAAREQALRSLNALLSGRLGGFLLGTVVRRNHLEPAPTFALTGFLLDVHPDPAAPGAGTLAYLGQFAHRPLPTDAAAARFRLADAWVRPEQLDGTEASIAGTLAVSKHAIFDQHLIPRLTEALGVEPRCTHPGSWAFGGGTDRSRESKDIIARKLRILTDWEVTLTIEPGGNSAGLSGRIGASILYDGYTLDLGIIGRQHTEWMHPSGHRPITGRLTVTGTGQGAQFGLAPVLTHTIGDLVIDDPGKPVGGAKVLDAFGSLAKGLGLVGRTPAEQLRGVMDEEVGRIGTGAAAALDKAKLSMAQHAFIPPGGGAYSMSRPRFSSAGDLLLDVLYRAP